MNNKYYDEKPLTSVEIRIRSKDLKYLVSLTSNF